MKIELTDLSAVKKSLVVEAEPEELVRETDESVRRIAKQARIPGFRPGKAPVDVIRKRFWPEIQEDVRERLVSRLYVAAAREKGLRPIGDPTLDELVHEDDKPFRFKTTFEVLPVLEPKNYKGVEVRQRSSRVGEQEVDEALESLREAHARYVTEDGRASQTGDILVADVEETPEGGEPDLRENAMIEVGLPQQLPAFNEALHGAVAGAELNFTVRYPDAHPSQKLAGRDVKYAVKVREIKRKDVPALDDEFAKDMGEFESLAALRARVVRDLEARKAAEARSTLRQEILDKVLLENVVALPEILVEEEIRHRLEDMVRAMVMHGMDPRKEEFDWKGLRDRQEEPARKVVHARLLLDSVSAAEGIAVTAEDVDARIRAEAERIGETFEALRAKLLKSDGVEALKIQMVREKTLDFLTSIANIQDAE
jgi:trigger factor